MSGNRPIKTYVLCSHVTFLLLWLQSAVLADLNRTGVAVGEEFTNQTYDEILSTPSVNNRNLTLTPYNTLETQRSEANLATLTVSNQSQSVSLNSTFWRTGSENVFATHAKQTHLPTTSNITSFVQIFGTTSQPDRDTNTTTNFAAVPEVIDVSHFLNDTLEADDRDLKNITTLQSHEYLYTTLPQPNVNESLKNNIFMKPRIDALVYNETTSSPIPALTTDKGLGILLLNQSLDLNEFNSVSPNDSKITPEIDMDQLLVGPVNLSSLEVDDNLFNSTVFPTGDSLKKTFSALQPTFAVPIQMPNITHKPDNFDKIIGNVSVYMYLPPEITTDEKNRSVSVKNIDLSNENQSIINETTTISVTSQRKKFSETNAFMTMPTSLNDSIMMSPSIVGLSTKSTIDLADDLLTDYPITSETNASTVNFEMLNSTIQETILSTTTELYEPNVHLTSPAPNDQPERFENSSSFVKFNSSTTIGPNSGGRVTKQRFQNNETIDEEFALNLTQTGNTTTTQTPELETTLDAFTVVVSDLIAVLSTQTTNNSLLNTVDVKTGSMPKSTTSDELFPEFNYTKTTTNEFELTTKETTENFTTPVIVTDFIPSEDFSNKTNENYTEATNQTEFKPTFGPLTSELPSDLNQETLPTDESNFTTLMPTHILNISDKANTETISNYYFTTKSVNLTKKPQALTTIDLNETTGRPMFSKAIIEPELNDTFNKWASSSATTEYPSETTPDFIDRIAELNDSATGLTNKPTESLVVMTTEFVTPKQQNETFSYSTSSTTNFSESTVAFVKSDIPNTSTVRLTDSATESLTEEKLSSASVKTTNVPVSDTTKVAELTTLKMALSASQTRSTTESEKITEESTSVSPTFKAASTANFESTTNTIEIQTKAQSSLPTQPSSTSQTENSLTSTESSPVFVNISSTFQTATPSKKIPKLPNPNGLKDSDAALARILLVTLVLFSVLVAFLVILVIVILACRHIRRSKQSAYRPHMDLSESAQTPIYRYKGELAFTNGAFLKGDGPEMLI